MPGILVLWSVIGGGGDGVCKSRTPSCGGTPWSNKIGLLASGTFCFLLLFSAVGGGRLAVVDEIVEHGDGVLCGGFCTNVVFFDVALCDGIRVLCGLLCAGCGYDVSGIANLAANDMDGEGRRIFLYLQGGLIDRGVDWDYLVGKFPNTRNRVGFRLPPT